MSGTVSQQKESVVIHRLISFSSPALLGISNLSETNERGKMFLTHPLPDSLRELVIVYVHR